MRIARKTACALAFLPFALAGCEMRQEAEEPAPAEAAPAEEAITAPVPQETETPVASIIREDALPGPIIELPPEPVRRTIPFAEGGSDLSERAERVLAEILEADALEEDWPIILRGHTDSVGSDEGNIRASRARAEAVAAWLVDRGVEDERIEVIAMGEQNPVAPNALPDGSPNEEGRARNRRVEVEIAPPEPEEVLQDAQDAPASDAAEPAGENAPSEDETA